MVSGGFTNWCLEFQLLGLMKNPVENSFRFKLYVILHLTGHLPEELVFDLYNKYLILSFMILYFY